jgi:FkbM family methyltransferase
MSEKERFRDIAAFHIVNIFQATFKARLMDKLPLYREARFCKGVYCYISSMVELRRSERTYLPEIYTWLKSFQPGDVFYDIGANIGMFSLTTAKLHEGQVKSYAFEPSFSTFGSLVRNIIGNQFEKIIIPFSIALSNIYGMRNFNYSDISSGTSVHTLDTVVNQTGMEFIPAFHQQVITYPLDELVAHFGLPVPTHIKIDVDGNEYEIIEGMKDTLGKDNVKSVLVEITETQEEDERVKQIQDIFHSKGFKRALDVPHSDFKKYPLVSDVLFTKNWELPYD